MLILFLVNMKLNVAFSQHTLFVTQPIQVTNTVYYSVSVCINDGYILYIYLNYSILYQYQVPIIKRIS